MSDVFDTIPLTPFQPLPQAYSPQLRCHLPPVTENAVGLLALKWRATLDKGWYAAGDLKGNSTTFQSHIRYLQHHTNVCENGSFLCSVVKKIRT
jgi:hypothetical protein